jgi:hypothetical protein
MSRIAPIIPANTQAKVAATTPRLGTSLMPERIELQALVKHMTAGQIASAIRYLDPDPGSERSGKDRTALVIGFSLLILLIGALAFIWLFLQTSG